MHGSYLLVAVSALTLNSSDPTQNNLPITGTFGLFQFITGSAGFSWRDRTFLLQPAACSGGTHVEKTKTCTNQWFAHFGWNRSFNRSFTSTAPSFFDYAKAVDLVQLSYGARGVDLICGYNEEFKKCLGASIMKTNPTCLSPVSFAQMYGMNDRNASLFSADLKIRNYECVNRNVTVENMSCMHSRSHVDALVSCVREARESMGGGVDECTAHSRFVICAENHYVDCGPDARDSICDMTVLFLNTIAPSCRDQLPLCGAIR